MPYFKQTSIDPDGGLRQVVKVQKPQIDRPYPDVLGDRQSPQRSVKCPASATDPALVHQELNVVNPYTRHLKTTEFTLTDSLGQLANSDRTT